MKIDELKSELKEKERFDKFQYAREWTDSYLKKNKIKKSSWIRSVMITAIYNLLTDLEVTKK